MVSPRRGSNSMPASLRNDNRRTSGRHRAGQRERGGSGARSPGVGGGQYGRGGGRGRRPDRAGEGIVTGDVVNTTARIQSVAPVNSVAVSQQTYRATSRVFAYEPLARSPSRELWNRFAFGARRRPAPASGATSATVSGRPLLAASSRSRSRSGSSSARRSGAGRRSRRRCYKTSLSFLVVAGRIGVQLDLIRPAACAALVAAGLLSVLLFPLTALMLLRGAGQKREDLLEPAR